MTLSLGLLCSCVRQTCFFAMSRFVRFQFSRKAIGILVCHAFDAKGIFIFSSKTGYELLEWFKCANAISGYSLRTSLSIAILYQIWYDRCMAGSYTSVACGRIKFASSNTKCSTTAVVYIILRIFFRGGGAVGCLGVAIYTRKGYLYTPTNLMGGPRTQMYSR